MGVLGIDVNLVSEGAKQVSGVQFGIKGTTKHWTHGRKHPTYVIKYRGEERAAWCRPHGVVGLGGGYGRE